ncbi:MAG: protease Do [Betaproteobacteria bacterium HGW-Betaproteobacteria-11]|nr:MAG: protease Do [Betaproteobacteria bacterium HGW-Betaproteobacteria-11]
MNRIFISLPAAFLVLFSVAAQSRELPDFTELVEKQGPAVVNISTTQTIRGGQAALPFPFDEDDPAQEFFRRFFHGQIPGRPGMPQEYKTQSLGSGFIVSGDGYILTNAHVVSDADEVVVKLTDKREFKAKVIGADKRTDVALIKIAASNLPAVRLGDPSRLKVGEWVVAIGSPFGFENTVTAGIVSAKGRTLQEENYVPFIQTDVAINPGNSGGPLFNMQGEVVGINSQIYSRSGGYMGLAFSIPIDLAMDVQGQLRLNGKVNRGRLGIAIQEVSRDLAEAFGLGKPRGALVASVEKGAPAEKAGIEAGDIILSFAGKPVGESGDLPRLVGSTKPGSKVGIQIWRKGGTRDLTVTVGEISDDAAPSRQNGGKTENSARANRLGLILSMPTSEQKQALGINHGLIVNQVVNGGTRTDLRRGDIILSLTHKGEQTEVTSVAQFNDLLAGFDKTATLTLLVRRGAVQTFVVIKGLADK